MASTISNATFSLQLPSSWDEAVALYNSALSHGDARVRNWACMDPLVVLLLIALYLLTIALLVLFTRNRKEGFSLKTVSMIHNIHLTLLSLYMLVEIVRQALINNYSLFGNAVDATPNGEGMARVLHIYFLSKIAEFGDTFIMALKKNYHQITFLHVYHHTSIFIIWWIIVYYAPGGEAYFSAALNSFIHVVMYGYYLWSSAAGKSKDLTRKPTWTEPAFYRQYITTMQITQFTMMLGQAVYDMVYPPLNYPYFCIQILFYYMLTMLALFGNFFLQSYVKDGKNKPKAVAQKKIVEKDD